ncbi:MAG: GHMP kinase [Methanocorpusculum sp.]|nr:GHMP kinase [Methanocorpusculum sp.]MDE2523079.1 GHMP kinase [Methanocorpusculum sp.]MDE2523896.1 GHMP kinase [Methanocorpusculum sp.]
MERTAVAFAPGHISGYFQRIDGDTPRTTGSCGAGLVINRGVTATVRPADRISVVITDHLPTGDPLIRYGSGLIEELLDSFGISAAVETVADLPIGAGFGMSAAAILATLTAANAVFDLGLTECGIAERAHMLEVSHNTGLGDVAAAAGGGLAVRTAPGITGVATRMFPDADLCTVTFGSIFTPDIISSPEQMRKVSAAFPDRTPANLTEFMQNSRAFAEASGLIPREIRPVLAACDDAGIPASMTMLGCGVFATGRDAHEILAGFGRAIPLKICPHGPTLMEM